jgi:hypothetical protein
MANEKILNTRIINKHASLADWRETGKTGKGADFKLKEGEIALARIELTDNKPTSGENNNISTTPAYIVKVGTEGNNFDESAWAYAKAVDVFAWAKQANLPVECGDDTTAEGYVEGNVISAISFEDGKIKYTTATVATSEGFEDLTGRVAAIEGYLEISEDEDGNPVVGLVNRVAALESIISGEDNGDAFKALSDRGYGWNIMKALESIVGSGNYHAESGATLAGLMDKFAELIGSGESDDEESIEGWTNIGKLAYRLMELERNFDGDGSIELNDGSVASNLIDLLSYIVGENWDSEGPNLTRLQQSIDDIRGDIESPKSLAELEEAINALDVIVNGEATDGSNSLEARLTISCEGHTTVDDENNPLFKRHVIKQGGETVCTIDIPKDLVVQDGELITATAADKAIDDEVIVGDKYIKLVIANTENTAIYIAVKDLVDVYTAEANAAQVQLDISDTNEISATIVAGSIGTTELAADAVTTAKITDKNVTKAKLEQTVQDSLDLADSALQVDSLIGRISIGYRDSGNTNDNGAIGSDVWFNLDNNTDRVSGFTLEAAYDGALEITPKGDFDNNSNFAYATIDLTEEAKASLSNADSAVQRVVVYPTSSTGTDGESGGHAGFDLCTENAAGEESRHLVFDIKAADDGYININTNESTGESLIAELSLDTTAKTAIEQAQTALQSVTDNDVTPSADIVYPEGTTTVPSGIKVSDKGDGTTQNISIDDSITWIFDCGGAF